MRSEQRPWRYFNLLGSAPGPDYPGLIISIISRFRVVEARVIQKKLSDHYPVLAILAPPASGIPNLEAILQEQAGVSVAQSSGRPACLGLHCAVAQR